MKKRWITKQSTRIGQYLVVAVLVASPLYLFSQESGEETVQNNNASQYPALENFDLILDRNIFSPNRRPRRNAPPPVERTPDPDEIVLTGTIVTEKERFAFFEDSRSGNITVVSTGQTFLGFNVDEVNTNQVILKKDDSPYEVSVLMALRKEQGAEWEVGTPTTVRRGSTSTSRSNRGPGPGSRDDFNRRRDDRPNRDSSSGESSNESSGSGDVQNEVLRKLLEQRRQEAGS